MISIVSYGLGNVASIINMIQKVGGKAKVCYSPADLSNATKIIVPGVGAFDQGIHNLHAGGWVAALNDLVLEEKLPVLGICLGMQLMCKSSEEGSAQGLAWIDAKVNRFNFDENDKNLKIPHMGWNTIKVEKKNGLINVKEDERFYFVHSYHVNCNSEQDVLATANYGYDFTCAFNKDNIYGVQFHPEKSHQFGMGLIKNFIDLQ